MNIQKALEKLPLVPGLDGMVKVNALFKDEDRMELNGNLMIIADGVAADYYGEYRGGYNFIDPKLMAWAKAKKGFWEWQNPEVIVFYNL